MNAINQDDWDIQDYLNGDLKLVQVGKGTGANNVGMVAWLVGRQVILITNDITHKAGIFGTCKDVVFKLASEFARENKFLIFMLLLTLEQGSDWPTQ
eukprot:9552678-Ditylum_brightwellii.AAC.1